MRLVEIVKQENGAHRNNNIHGVLYPIPEGWAVIPEDMETENFPFGDLTAIEIESPSSDGKVLKLMTVVEWIPGVKPEPIITPASTPEPTTSEILDTLLGVTE